MDYFGITNYPGLTKYYSFIFGWAIFKFDDEQILQVLTFLNIRQLERQGADIMSKAEELEEVNHSVKERDERKDDAISMLSDQILTITERLKELESNNWKING